MKRNQKQQLKLISDRTIVNSSNYLVVQDTAVSS